MKKITRLLSVGFISFISVTAMACPKGTTLTGGTGPNHKGGTCVPVNAQKQIADTNSKAVVEARQKAAAEAHQRGDHDARNKAAQAAKDKAVQDAKAKAAERAARNQAQAEALKHAH